MRQRPGLARLIAAAAAVLPVVGIGSAPGAQTLTEPKPLPPTAPQSQNKTAPAVVNSCSAFGPGFVRIPGTDACVKIGGSVNVEGGARR